MVTDDDEGALLLSGLLQSEGCEEEREHDDVEREFKLNYYENEEEEKEHPVV